MIRLFEHNQTAYDAVTRMLSECGKAAVIHPTGTGKSFIAFKLAEDHPYSAFVWLSPSENIYETQVENLKKAAGSIPGNIRFLTYAKLTYMSEQDLAAIPAEYIILDEFHRAGAKEWGRAVQQFLDLNPEAKLLGLSATNVRYLDRQRDMAEELFDGCVADQMNLGEAVQRGILPAPKYVVSFYAPEWKEEKYRKRMRHASIPVRREAEKLLKQLRGALDRAEGLEAIFPRHMTEPHGKYIVFCTSVEHLREMQEKALFWFRDVDPEPKMYAVWADSPEAKRDYEAFRKDDSDHLKLLFCVDMFNEGIHVEDLDGVILFRPTVSPILYKQQIGRALSSLHGNGTKQPVIFDIVNNFENLYSISALRAEMEPVVTFFSSEGQEIPVNSFRIIDEVREARELFVRLEDTLKLSWDAMYREAERFRETYGHLNVPKAYRTEEEIPLGSWIQTQRRIYRGSASGVLTPERIEKLNAIEMIWDSNTARTWERGIAHAKAYREKTGHLNVSYRLKAEDGFGLGHWLARVRAEKDTLTEDQIRQLDALGMVWQPFDASFTTGLQEAEAYRKEHGDLQVPAAYISDSGFRLGNWLGRLRRKYEKDPKSIPEDQIRQLEALGMDWRSPREKSWESAFEKANKYYKQYRHLQPPAGSSLFVWLSRQREYRRRGKLTAEQIQKLDALGMQWSSRNKSWEENYEQAKLYHLIHGDLEVPADYVTENGIWLGKWIAVQRADREKGLLSQEYIRKLDALNMRWEVMTDYRWNRNFEALRQYRPDPELGFTVLPETAETPFGGNLRRWAIREDLKYRTGRLSEERASKWAGLR